MLFSTFVWGNAQDAGEVATDGLLFPVTRFQGILAFESPVATPELRSFSAVTCASQIADFGTTRTMEDITSMATSEGTRHRYGTTLKWAAPEVLKDKPARAKSDVYSYGVVVWEIVSRQLPWQGVSADGVFLKVVIHGKRPEVPPGAPLVLASLMARCWAGSPEERFSFDEVLVDLAKV